MLSNYEIPGWTPVYTLGIFNLLIFSTIFTLVLVLVQLGNRNIVKSSPKHFLKILLIEIFIKIKLAGNIKIISAGRKYLTSIFLMNGDVPKLSVKYMEIKNNIKISPI